MTDINKQQIPELQKHVADLREKLRTFRFEGAGSRSRNVREGRNIRREIAQVLTELRARALSSNVASETKKA